MLILKPIAKETLWGGKRLAPYADKFYKNVGMLYSVAASRNFSNKIINGPYKGLTFDEYFSENKHKFNLGHYSLFPFTVALMESGDDLSIQVHPDRKTAFELENLTSGRNESWYFIEPPSSGYLYNGCKCKSHSELKTKLLNDRIDEAVGALKVKKGDYVFVESGTIHAITKGAFLYEITENSDVTYRLHDFNRLNADGTPRELHLDKALKAAKLSLKSKTMRYGDKKTIEEPGYITCLHENVSSYSNHSETLECLTMLGGVNIIEGFEIKTGITVVLEPGETVKLNKASKFMVARPRIKKQQLFFSFKQHTVYNRL